MSLASANGVAILSGTILMPQVGVWIADLVLDQLDTAGFAPGTAVTITSTNGFELVGTVATDRSGDFLDTLHVRVLGGAAGMSKMTTPRSFAAPGALVGDVLNSILDDAGERLSDTVDAAFLSTNLDAWTIVRGAASDALRVLLAVVAPMASWRVLADGTLWIGDESWPSDAPTFELLEQNPVDGIYELGVDAPAILPGTTVDGVGRIARVKHCFLPDRIRSTVWTPIADGARGERAAIADVVHQETAAFDYHALYDFAVVSQSDDLKTLDVTPGTLALAERIPGLGRVRLRHGLPGMSVVVPVGASVLVGWERGDPSRPYVALYTGEEATAWTLNGDLTLQHLLSAQTGTPPLPPISSDAKLTINPGSTDRAGTFTLSGYASGGSVSVDVTYARSWPNAAWARCWPVDGATNDNLITTNDGAGSTGINMAVFVDLSASDKTKFRVANTQAGSLKNPNGTYGYAVDGY